MKQIQLVIFDMDGVLTDTNPSHYQAWEKVFTEKGYYFDESIFKDKIEARPRMEGIASVAVGAALDEQKEMSKKKTEYFLEGIESEPPTVFDDALEFLLELKQKGIQTAVASSSTLAELLLTKMGIADLFNTIVSGNDVTNGKPHPEIFLTAAQRLAIKPKNCIVVEDAEVGVQAAMKAGMFTIGLTRRQNQLHKADVQVNSLKGITLETLEKWVKES